MKAVISYSPARGTVDAPPSKSYMQRIVAAALLANGRSVIRKPSLSKDSLASLRVAECLGANITYHDDSVVIDGGFSPRCEIIDCNESGLGARLFSAIASLHTKKIVISGKGSLLRRPMDELVNYLRPFDVNVKTLGGFLPIEVCGPMKGGRATLDGFSSSQYLSGLLMALPVCGEDSQLVVNNLSSRHYINITLDVMYAFGVKVINRNFKEFSVPGKQVYKPANINVEGDWSGASFMLVMGAMGQGITVNNLSSSSSQPDRKIIDFLRLAGADIFIAGDAITVKSAGHVPFVADISGSPDLAPPLVALASFCRGKSVLKGTSRLKIKESDRGKSLETEFRKLGVEIVNNEDSIEVTGGKKLHSSPVSSCGDHRIAMALAVAATGIAGETTIEDAGAVDKSYPLFFNDLMEMGVDCKIIHEGI